MGHKSLISMVSSLLIVAMISLLMSLLLEAIKIIDLTEEENLVAFVVTMIETGFMGCRL